MKKALLIVLIIFLVIVAAAFGGIVYLTSDTMLPEDVNMQIDEGSGTVVIADSLESYGIIRNATAFRIFARIQGVDSMFKAGEYVFSAGKWSMADVSEQLIIGGSSGNDILITITEGMRAKDILEILKSHNLTTDEAFWDYVTNADFPYDYLPAAGTENRLEGFLAPDSYFVAPDWTEKEIVDLLLRQFDEVVWTDERQALADARDMSVLEVMTMASIVEREAVIDADRPLIAGVFYNRLAIDMMLQSNVTVEYAMGEWKLDLTNQDIQIDSPYNTYRNIGLPPGPVCSPGVKSIDAALQPEDSDYLYFWGQEDGSTRFSLTLEEHQAGGEGDL